MKFRSTTVAAGLLSGRTLMVKSIDTICQSHRPVEPTSQTTAIAWHKARAAATRILFVKRRPMLMKMYKII